MTYVFEKGMYQGKKVEDVPESYLYFLVKRVGSSKPGLAAKAEINRRRKSQGLKPIA